MAYGYEKKIAEIDSDVELYLNENMHFEAWTMIIRNFDGDYDDLYNHLENEFYKKSTKLSEEDIESLYIEFLHCRDKAEEEAWE